MDRESKMIAYYYQVAETIRGRILSRDYEPGEIIPSERELAREFGVSNITIRKAMSLLVQDGFVSRRRGIGTRVVPRRDDRLAIKITGNFRDWFDSAIGRKERLTTEVLEIIVTSCQDRIREILGLPVDAKIWRMKRVRKLKGEAISYYLNYASPSLQQKVDANDFQRRSFIEVFQERCGIRLARIEQRVEASVADMDVSAILGVEFGAPVFFVENIYHARGSGAVEVTHMYYRGDRYIYQTNIELDEEA